MKVGPLYYANLNSTADIAINQGGTDSGKTYALIQVAFTICTTTTPPEEDPIFTIVNQSVPNSKKGAYRIAKSIYNSEPQFKDMVLNWNEGERVVYFSTGWVLEFLGATDEQNAKQGKRQYLYANEADGISWPIFWQMAKRTRIRTWIDYNPSAPFWAHENLIGTTKEGNDLFASVQLIISDHRHNPFLSDKDHARTENIKDPQLWRVYARGITGNIAGLVFPNWRQIPDSEFPFNSDDLFVGIDFGYTNDPTAVVLICRVGDSIFLHEVCYTTALSPRKIVTLLQANRFNIEDERPVYCEHDKDMIRELRALGLLALPARKGQGSKFAGISKVKEYNVFYTASSKNIDMERKKYMFIRDPVTGRLTNTVVDKDDHLLDATRYGIYSHYFRDNS